MHRTCFRCDTALERPLPDHANYVRGSDTTETEPREAYVALVHTDETRRRAEEAAEKLDRDVQAVAAEQAHPDAPDTVDAPNGTRVEEREGGTVETADFEEIEYNVPRTTYDEEVVDSPNAVQHREDVARVETTVIEEDVQKTGLVCPDCLREEDEIIWGESA